MRLALETIAKLENLVATDAELEEEYKRIADGYGVELDKVKEAIASEDIAADVVVKKAFDLVKDAAVVAKKTAKKAAAADKADAEVAEEKPAAKKTTAKKTTAKKAAEKTDEEKPAAKKAPAKKTAKKAEESK